MTCWKIINRSVNDSVHKESPINLSSSLFIWSWDRVSPNRFIWSCIKCWYRDKKTLTNASWRMLPKRWKTLKHKNVVTNQIFTIFASSHRGEPPHTHSTQKHKSSRVLKRKTVKVFVSSQAHIDNDGFQQTSLLRSCFHLRFHSA